MKLAASALSTPASPSARNKEPNENPPPEQKRDANVQGKNDAGAPASRWGTKRLRAMIAVFVVTAAAGGFTWWWLDYRSSAPTELVLQGNVDLRQVALPFNNNERIAAVLVQEGDHVHKGELLARLDTSRLEPQVAQAAAQVAAQRAAVARLHNGSRPEEIAEARANLESAKANALNAGRQFARKAALLATSSGAQTDVDTTKSAAGMADAQVEVNQKALDLAIAGPRQEDIDQGEAQLRGNEAQLAYLRQQLADAELRAPLDSVVRSRLMEPGEMASPQRPVFSLAIVDPKWVRAYVTETDLGHVHPGMKAVVTADAFPKPGFDGWVGFISPIAEFTPKTVQTTDLRTSLVYEIRVFVKDPNDDLRLGMPTTVHLPLGGIVDARGHQ